MPIDTLSQRITKGKTLKWINITNTEKEEIEYLKKNFNFSLRHLRDSLNNIYAQRLKIEESKTYLFIILMFPVFDAKKQEITAAEIDCFVGKNYLITIHDKKLKPINSLFNLSKKDKNIKKEILKQNPLYILGEILTRIYKECFSLLDLLNINITALEEKIFSGYQRESIDDILILKHNIINFRRLMQSHRNVLRKITSQKKYFSASNRLVYNNLIQYTIDIWDIVQSQKEMLEALEYTNDSMLSYRMSDIMKTLTIFSVIVFPLTLFAAIFGMNTINGMPFVNNPHGFWFIIGFMILGVIFMFGFFKKKNWI